MPKPVYALIGPDSFLQTEKLRQVLSTLGKDVQRTDLDGERAELAEVLDEARSFAMFGGSKLIVLRNADEFVSKYREQLENYLESPSDSATLVLRFNSMKKTERVYKLIAKMGQIEECYAPDEKHVRELVAWIATRAKSAHKLSLKPEGAQLLADLIGSDLGRLDNELAKLALQCEGKPIGPDEIRSSVAFQREQEMFELTNALATGKTDEALKRWRQLLQLDSSAEFRAVTWLGMWLEDVRCFVETPNAFKNFWRYKEQFGQFKQIAQSIGKHGVTKLVDLLADVDYRSKTGAGDAAANVERFIVAASV